MAYSDYLSGAQFPPAGYRSAYKRAQEISANMPTVVAHGSRSRGDYTSEKRQTMRALMHSRVPAEHLQGISAIHTGVEHGGVGAYDPPSKSIEMGFDFREQRFGPREERHYRARAQHGLVHEVGHHQTGKVQAFGGPGVQEGLAENYAEKHRGTRYSAKDYGPSIYDEDVKDKIGHIGEVPRERAAYKKVRKAKELPRGHGEF